MASPLAQCRAPGTTGNTQSFPLGGWIWCQDRSTTSCLGLAPPGRIPRPTPVFLPGEFYGQRRLVGYSLRGCKELDMIEQLTHLAKYLGEGNGTPLQCSCLENPMEGGA